MKGRMDKTGKGEVVEECIYVGVNYIATNLKRIRLLLVVEDTTIFQTVVCYTHTHDMHD